MGKDSVTLDDTALDDTVIDAALSMASNANNGGISEQIEFLLVVCGWTMEEIAAHSEVSIKDLENHRG